MLGAALLAGCQSEIGDRCTLSTDCSLRGDRLCDTSQPGGYCTVFECRGNRCPDKAACVLFGANVPGCVYDDRSGSRIGRTFCMAACESNADCRSGYVCADPKAAPWRALILDDVQEQHVCIVDRSASTPVVPPDAAAPICATTGPDASLFDAGPAEEAGVDADAGAPLDAAGGG